ncbi:MAG: substrate-binding domain-containing protein [Pseudomonadota bacterium]
MATLKDISAELGLSVATVSRALNGFPEVNQKTRDKVQEAAERLGYRPNRVAQRLVTGRSGMVGLIVKIKPDMSADQTFFEVLTGLTAGLAARDTELVLAVDQGEDAVAPYRRMIEKNILDGFILNEPVVDDPRVAFLLERKMPFVLHGTDRDDPPYPFYRIDNQKVAADAVDLLGHLGHRRIALINGRLRHHYAHERLEGFLKAMGRHGLSADLVSTENVVGSDAYMSALELLGLPDAPTAFVCASTPLADGVCRAIRDKGLRMPEDVSVVAHDDAMPLTKAVKFDPALTVTRSPLRDACEPLANMLMDHLNGTPTADLQVTLTAELIVRGSTGPAPKRGITV